MRRIFLLALIALLFSGCDMDKREKELDNRSAELAQKEQELLLLQKQLQLKEEALSLREKSVDSTLRSNLIKDSIAVYKSGILGNWNVKMQCTETTCEGSAIGDVKNEQWNIVYEHHTVLVKAMANNSLVHVYTGTYEDSMVQLKAQQDAAATTDINVKLQVSGKNNMEGTREIKRGEDCAIIYALDLTKL